MFSVVDQNQKINEKKYNSARLASVFPNTHEPPNRDLGFFYKVILMTKKIHSFLPAPCFVFSFFPKFSWLRLLLGTGQPVSAYTYTELK